MIYFGHKEAAALSVDVQLRTLKLGSRLTMIITPDTSGGFYATFATEELSEDIAKEMGLSFLRQGTNT